MARTWLLWIFSRSSPRCIAKVKPNSTFAMSTCAGLRGCATARKRGFPQRFAQCANLHNHKVIRGLRRLMRSVQTCSDLTLFSISDRILVSFGFVFYK